GEHRAIVRGPSERGFLAGERGEFADPDDVRAVRLTAACGFVTRFLFAAGEGQKRGGSQGGEECQFFHESLGTHRVVLFVGGSLGNGWEGFNSQAGEDLERKT